MWNLFKFSCKDIKKTANVNNIILMFLLLILKKFHRTLCCHVLLLETNCACCVWSDSFIHLLNQFHSNNLANSYLFKVNKRKTGRICKICSKLTITIPEWRNWHRSGVFIINFEHISHFFQVFLSLALNR